MIARSEYRGWPPRDLRRGAAQCFRASPVIQTVKSPRFRRLSLYPHQFVTRYFFFANLCRREVLNLCGIKHIRGRGKSLCQSRRKKGPFAGVKVGQLRCRALLGVLPIKLTVTRRMLAKGQHPSSSDRVQALAFRLCFSRKLSPFISSIWTWWVRRSRSAPVRRPDPNISVHSSNGRFEVMIMEPQGQSLICISSDLI